jgi:hypothetical protein
MQFIGSGIGLNQLIFIHAFQRAYSVIQFEPLSSRQTRSPVSKRSI